MNPVDVKNLALAHKSEGRTHTEIGKLLQISRNSVINLYSFKIKSEDQNLLCPKQKIEYQKDNWHFEGN